MADKKAGGETQALLRKGRETPPGLTRRMGQAVHGVRRGELEVAGGPVFNPIREPATKVFHHADHAISPFAAPPKPPPCDMLISRTDLFSLVLIVFMLSGSVFAADNQTSSKVSSVTGGKRWYRGNTHTHARFSDNEDQNDVPVIAGWYKDAGYDFLVLSEHGDHLSKKKVVCHEEAAVPPGFIMICGLEISGKGRHVTALGITNYVGDAASFQEGVNQIIANGGVPILNHPQAPGMTSSSFAGTKGVDHLEVFNGNRPNQTAASEKLWDDVLSSPDGRRVFAVAADDNHFTKSKVGRGWIMVESPTLAKEDIVESVRKGGFYATTGIVLRDYLVTGHEITVDTQNGNKIMFIGRNGVVLKSVNDTRATYQIAGDELYVRVKITNQDGKMAWTQPVFIK